MSLVKQEFAAQTVDATGETIYIAVAGDLIQEVWFTNVTDTDATIELWRVKNGQSATNNNKKVNGTTIPANDFAKLDCNWGMAVDDFIYAKCGTIDAICVSVSGVNKS